MSGPSSGATSRERPKVVAVNRAYYDALSARDMSAMELVWTCTAKDMLVAPPVNPVTHIGWPAIKQNWEAYWPQFDEFSVSMEVTSVQINGPVAWVHGIETSYRLNKTGEVSNSRNYGTNIFELTGDQWQMVFHQSALISDK